MGGQFQSEVIPALPIDTVKGSIPNDVLVHALDIGGEKPTIQSIVRDAVKGKR